MPESSGAIRFMSQSVPGLYFWRGPLVGDQRVAEEEERKRQILDGQKMATYVA